MALVTASALISSSRDPKPQRRMAMRSPSMDDGIIPKVWMKNGKI